jgi:hypothetical protein
MMSYIPVMKFIKHKTRIKRDEMLQIRYAKPFFVSVSFYLRRIENTILCECKYVNHGSEMQQRKDFRRVCITEGISRGVAFVQSNRDE